MELSDLISMMTVILSSLRNSAPLLGGLEGKSSQRARNRGAQFRKFSKTFEFHRLASLSSVTAHPRSWQTLQLIEACVSYRYADVFSASSSTDFGFEPSYYVEKRVEQNFLSTTS
jgi:hypothetical protein